MKNRSLASGLLVAFSCLMWFGIVLPDLVRLQDGVLKGYGYLYYNTPSAILNLAAAFGTIVVSIIAARVVGRGGADGRYRSVTVGVVGVLVVQAIIGLMIPVGFLLGFHFQ